LTASFDAAGDGSGAASEPVGSSVSETSSANLVAARLLKKSRRIMERYYAGPMNARPTLGKAIIQVDLNTEGRIAHVYLVLSSSKLTAIHF